MMELKAERRTGWARTRSRGAVVLRIGTRVAGCALVAGFTIAAVTIAVLGSPPLGRTLDYSTLVVDREGRLLRPYATPEGRWRLPATRENVDPRFVRALLAYEDKRFESHFGVDPLALARAALQLIRSRHIVSGGSTITMQVARLLEPRRARSVFAKLREIVRAIEIERILSKDEILGLYLSLAPAGGNLEGIRAAALAYFGKEPRRLSLAETALLVALPQSPEARRPDHSSEAARRARDRVLDRLASAALIPPDEVAQARREPVPEGRQPMPMLGPHAADRAVAAAPARKLHRLTLDATLQRSLEALAQDRAAALGPEISVAIVAVDNASGEILARVGSANFFDRHRAGQVDMTTALRSPGSALKPFIYGLAFEDGLIHPETLIDDRPVRYGTYAPENFDLAFQGTITVRHALQQSLNVPAVGVLDAVGPERLAARLSEAGAELVLPKGEAPGLAIGLGGVGIRLTDLTMLYAGLARLGTAIPVSERRDRGPELPRRLLDPVAAWYVGNILLGTPPPENAVGGRIAFKTGTSYGDRDAWAIGFDGRETLGVWVGRPDGAPVPGLVGRSAAAPILFEAFARQERPTATLLPAPKGTLICASARLPMPLRQFRSPGSVGQRGDPLRILFPPNGVTLERAAGADEGPLALRVTGGVAPLTVLVNGIALADPVPGGRNPSWEPDGPGFVRLTVIDAQGAADSVVVRVQ
jgi:penicillin-binding protein 1C